MLLVLATGAWATLAVDEQGRFYLYVIDSSGNPTDATDDVEVRPHGDTSPGAAIDATYLGGLSSTWYWSVDWFDDQEVYKLYVNGTAQQDSLQMDNAIENSVAAASIQDDAVTPAKLDSDGAFQLDPSTTSSALRVDFDTSDPAAGTAFEVDFGGQAQTGLDLGQIAVTNQIGISASVSGSGSGQGISVVNAATGSSAKGIVVTTSAEGAGASGLEVGNAGDGTAVRIDNVGDTQGGTGLWVYNNSGTVLPVGIRAESDLGGRTAVFEGTELALRLETEAEVDTSLHVVGGLVLLDATDAPYGTNEGFVEMILPDAFTGDGIHIETNGSGAMNGIRINHDNTGLVTNGIRVVSSASGANAAGMLISTNQDDAFGLRIHHGNPSAYSDMVPLFVSNSTGAPAPEVGGQLAVFEASQNSGTEAEVVRIEQKYPNWGIVIDHDAANGFNPQGGIYIATEDGDTQESGVRIGLGGTTPSSQGVRVETVTGTTGSIYQVFNNGTFDGKVLDIDFGNAPGKDYDGPGMIYLDEAAADFTMAGPLIYFDAETSLGADPLVKLWTDTQLGGTLVSVKADSANAIEVLDGYVDLNAAEQLMIPTAPEWDTDPRVPGEGSFFFEPVADELKVYESGSWYSVGMTASALPRVGVSSADTLVIPFGESGYHFSGSGCSLWAGATIYVHLARIGYTDGNFCTCSEAIIPSRGARDSVEVTYYVSSSGAGGNNHVLTSKVSFFKAGEGWDSWSSSAKDTVTMVANAQDPVAVTFAHGLSGSADTADIVIALGLERNSNDAGDTGTSEYTYIHPGGRVKAF